MAQKMLILTQAIILYILLKYIHHVHGKDCWIMRDKRDKIRPISKATCTPSNNPCSKFIGSFVLGESECTCICPPNKPTYMETTNNCSAYSDIQSKCNLSFRRQLSTIPTFSMNLSTSLRLNIPKKFRSCRMVASRGNSFYLSRLGWNQVPQKYEFPFRVETRIVKKRLQIAYLKWKLTKVPPELKGKVFRLGITCRKKQDCVILKISGKTLNQCIVDATPTNPPSPSSSSPSFMPSVSTKPTTTKYVRPILVSQPSASNKDSRESSSVKIPWSVIGTVLGILVALSVCIIILAVCFCRRRKKLLEKKRTGNASTQSSGVTLSSAESQPEVTYASPHHPYQELKPPISGTPRGTYQPLKWNAREDASGYMLPSESSADPLYNEIGSLTRGLPPVYDYALPENTVRLTNHLSNSDLRMKPLPIPPGARNDPVYIGRTSHAQEEPKSPSSDGAAPAPVNDGPTSPAYLDFTSEGANQAGTLECKSPDNNIPKGAPGSSRYKKPVNGRKSPFAKSPSEERPYQELESPCSPVNDPFILSRENLEDSYDKESKA